MTVRTETEKGYFQESVSTDAPILIQPSKRLVNLRELWSYRELLYFLVWRDLKVRYKQTFLGASWAIIQPLSSMLVFALFFGKLAKIPSDGIPYPIFVYCGLLVWGLFARALTDASTSLVTNERIVTKIYFPRILVPIASVVASLADFVIAFVLLLGMMFYYHISPGWGVLTLPAFILLALATGSGLALWLSALDVQYRDIRYTLPFLTQFWMYVTPVVYPASLVPEKWRWLYGLNPMAGVVEGFRYALLGKPMSSVPMLFVSMGVVALMLLGGLAYFGKMERTFADVI